MKKVKYEAVRPNTDKIEKRVRAEFLSEFALTQGVDTLEVISYVVDSGPTEKQLRELWFKEIMEQVKINIENETNHERNI